MSDTVLYDKQDHIATITLNRPERHNALNREAYDTAAEMFRRANAESDVRCIIFTGAGRSFCSGDDVAEIMAAGDGLAGSLGKTSSDSPTDSPTPSTTPAMVVEMRNARSPIIAAVNGAAVGFGMELTLVCDIRVASEAARFSEMFIKRGIIATDISYDLLPGIVGPAMAAEMLLTGDMIDAQQALSAGLVSKVVSADALLESAREIAARIAVNAPLAVERAKQGLRLKQEHQREEMQRYLANSLRDLSQTADHKESVAAFMEKRAPVYRGE
jgi:enoyl-CoA hydratase/carnithine racemase